MSGYLDLDGTPANEECYGVGHPKSRDETRIYRDQLRREFPTGSFTIKSNPHDFGVYYSVAANMHDDETTEAAWHAESGASVVWDSIAIEQIKALKERA